VVTADGTLENRVIPGERIGTGTASIADRGTRARRMSRLRRGSLPRAGGLCLQAGAIKRNPLHQVAGSRATPATDPRAQSSHTRAAQPNEVLTMDVNGSSTNHSPGTPSIGQIARVAAGALGLATVGYAATSALLWAQYGRPPRARHDEEDSMLDRFMPTYEVVERHRITVEAPAAITLAVAGEQDLMSNPMIRAIFMTRALVMGSTSQAPRLPRQLLPLVRSIGWRVLGENCGREIVVGAVTRPWQADVTFQGLNPDAFAAFTEPGYVKIAWSLRADSLGPDRSIFRTETRAIATDPISRAKFRRYWAFASPGIWLIRRASLRPLKFKAEHRARRQKENTARPVEYHAW
jgi:hypothetical protein